MGINCLALSTNDESEKVNILGFVTTSGLCHIFQTLKNLKSLLSPQAVQKHP